MKVPNPLSTVIARWNNTSLLRRILVVSMIIGMILGGTFVGSLYYIPPCTFLPYASLGLRITNEQVFADGRVSFTAICHFESYNYPLPQGILFQIEKIFLCTENAALTFNSTVGELKEPAEVTISEGTLKLALFDKVTIQYHSVFNLHNISHIYVGVIATFASASSATRWDRYTPVIATSLAGKLV